MQRVPAELATWLCVCVSVGNLDQDMGGLSPELDMHQRASPPAPPMTVL
jgi:hypothetical protein